MTRSTNLYTKDFANKATNANTNEKKSNDCIIDLCAVSAFPLERAVIYTVK